MLKQLSKKLKGFTLLEVLIVLGIIFILSHIATSSYQHYLIKSARVNAKIELLKVAAILESYYSQYYTYIGALADLDISITKDDRYQITISKLTQSNYTIEAIPKAVQQQDKQCGILTLNEKGEQSMSGTASVATCWR
jgi:type IV pilus assembly protein PilE